MKYLKIFETLLSPWISCKTYFCADKDIKDYDEKYKFLIENDWINFWNEDNWIKNGWWNQTRGVNRYGITTNEAYKLAKKI